MIRKKKMAYVLSHPIQYQSPLLAQLATHPEIDLHVYYLTDHTVGAHDVEFGRKVKWDIPLLEGYEYTFIKNVSPRSTVSLNFFDLINPELVKVFTGFKPDCIIMHGWGYLSNLYLLLLAKVFSVPVLIRGESPASQERGSSLNRRAKQVLLSLCSKYLYIGKQNKIFYQSFGIKDRDLFFTPYCIDNARFRQEYRLLDRDQLRHAKGMTPETVAIVTVGKYIPKKRPLDLIQAFAQLRKGLPTHDLRLFFVGSGELLAAMQEKAAELKVADFIEFTGFVNQSRISEYYQLADIFVLPSGEGETWGLVINEAMNFHLPVVVSNIVGSADDLVIDGVTGFQYPCGDMESLSSRLEILAKNALLRKKMGDAAAEHITRFSYGHVIEGIKQAIG